MEEVSVYLNHQWVSALGWTLIHSLWQSALIAGAVVVAIRCTVRHAATLRYAIACSGMVAMLVCAVATFFYQFSQQQVYNFGISQNVSSTNLQATEALAHPSDLIATIATGIESAMNWIIILWVTGALIFLLRMGGGWIVLRQLRRDAMAVGDEWQQTVQRLCTQLDVKKAVALAESIRIQSPMVIGYMKPVILLPLGMIGGLTTAQVEAILLHELAHIKRQDYLVNIIQSFVEVLFFFNPFTWVISGIIRKEREYCCDDMVITADEVRLDYARALAKLEEARIYKPLLVMSLAGEKKHLLNRIKRIMEKPLSNKMQHDRLVPVMLLVLGVVCASWLSIGGEEKMDNNTSVISTDTLKENESFQYRWSSDNASADAAPWRHAAPVVAPVPARKALPPVQVIPGAPFIYHADTVPFRTYRSGSIEKFSAEFEEAFKEKFSDFYKKNAKDFEKLMKEVQSNVEHEISEEVWVGADIVEFALPELEVEAMRAQEMAMAELQEHTDLQQVQLEQLHGHLEDIELANEEQLRAVEVEMQAMEQQMKIFDEKLKKELVKDGYISTSEEIKNIEWDDSGDIKVNGKNIKEQDKKKYQELHKKYFNGPGRFHHAE